MRTTSTSQWDPEDFEELKKSSVDHIQEILQEFGVERTGELSVFAIGKLKKDRMSEVLLNTLSLLDDLTCCVVDSSYAPRGVTAELLEAQRKIISLQSELLECKQEKLDSVKTVVQSSVCETVKEEIKSFSAVVQSGTGGSQKPLSQSVLKKVVQDVVKTEDRSKNVMIFGLSDEANEDTRAKVSELFDAMGEKPRIDVCRVGKHVPGGPPRPVKVVTTSSTVADQLMQKGRRLSHLEKYKRVYVNPDRSLEQREQRRELVKEVKRLTDLDKDKRHFIRNGKVCSVARSAT